MKNTYLEDQSLNINRPLRITTLGWLSILYPIFVIGAPIITIIFMYIFNPAFVEEATSTPGPIASPLYLLEMSGLISPVNVLIIKIIAVVTIVVPVLSFVGGIMLLKMKKSGRKILLIIFSADIIARLSVSLLILTNSYIKPIFWKDQSSFVFFVSIFIFEVLMVYLLAQSRNKE